MEKPSVKWGDVGGLTGVKEALKEHVILPLRFPELFRDNRRPRGGILLYGAGASGGVWESMVTSAAIALTHPSRLLHHALAPGAGKTFVVNAAVTEANNATFLRVASCDLVTTSIVESEKEIRNLFQLARQKRPSIIFIDDLDVAFDSSNNNESESSRRNRSELLIQMEGDNDDIVILTATSKPWKIDHAILNRFERRIYIKLPEEPEARSEIFKSNLLTTSHTLTETNFQELGKMTDGLSGADIAVAVRDAIMQTVRDFQTATHFRTISGPSQSDPNVMVNDLLTPCSPEAHDAIEMNWADVPVDKQLARAVNMGDFLQSSGSMKPTISDDDLEKLKRFTDKYC